MLGVIVVNNIQVGDKVYWFVLGNLRSGTVVKTSKWRNKIWIKDDEYDNVFEASGVFVNEIYFTSREDAIRKYLEVLDILLNDALSACQKVDEIRKEIEFWRQQLGGVTDELYTVS